MTGPAAFPIRSGVHAPARFIPSRFDALVEENGYDVIYERALECPCRSRAQSSFSSACRNCGGSGWVFVNEERTKMLVQGQAFNRQYRPEGEWQMGLASVTTLSSFHLGFMDRIRVLPIRHRHSQVIFPRRVGSNFYGLTDFEPLEVLGAWKFVNEMSPLEPVQIPESAVKRYGFDLTGIVDDDDASITVDYAHHATYHVWEITREQVKVDVGDPGSGELLQRMPAHALARRANWHGNTVRIENASGFELFRNTVLPPPQDLCSGLRL